jgi:hypothetical protein
MSRQLSSWWQKGVDRLHKLGLLAANPVDKNLKPSCLIRVVSALNYLVVIACLALWITAFILFRESSAQRQLSDNLFTNLSCITFFGGLAIAIIVGALLGNLLRRSLWHLLSRLKSR